MCVFCFFVWFFFWVVLLFWGFAFFFILVKEDLEKDLKFLWIFCDRSEFIGGDQKVTTAQ